MRNRLIDGRRISRRRSLLYGGATVAAAALLGFGAGEVALRAQRGRIEGSDALDRGLTEYDARLGWALAANWRGRHRHFDFDVGYTTNARAFRGPIEAASEPAALWLGDSFAFGLGVDDGATFIDRLDAARAGGLRHANLAVPGYSTDQQVLLLERRLSAFDARFIGLVVYLGNDLIDNGLAYPLQAATAKPYFELREGELVLRNSPAPRAPKPETERARGFGPRLFEMAEVAPRPLDRALLSIEAARWLDLERPVPPHDLEARLSPAMAPSVALFAALLRRLRQAGKPVAVVLVASRRHLLAPGSWSGRYQELARRALRDGGLGVPVVDLAEDFRSAASADRLHHPHEGHLTVGGHEAAAALIARGVMT
jgi:hypothetical protein